MLTELADLTSFIIGRKCNLDTAKIGSGHNQEASLSRKYELQICLQPKCTCSRQVIHSHKQTEGLGL